ncbi:MAG: hypothetical protein ACYC6N_08320 [Pirellulaceae bacterium]
MIVLLVTHDLLCSSRVASVASALGTELVLVGDGDELIRRIASVPAGLVLLDLTTPRLQTMDLVPRLRREGPAGMSIVAFGPHVHADALNGAREAGCDKVLPRGQFLNQLATILSPSASASASNTPWVGT